MTFHKQIPSFDIATSQSLIYPVNLLNTLAADPSKSISRLGFFIASQPPTVAHAWKNEGGPLKIAISRSGLAPAPNYSYVGTALTMVKLALCTVMIKTERNFYVWHYVEITLV